MEKVLSPPRLPAFFAARTPFFYGWAVLACLCFAGFARQGPAVSTLSVFVKPLIDDFGWSRTALSGAVVGSSRVDLQACKLEYSIVSPK